MKVNVVENLLSNNLISVTLDIRHNGIRIQRRLKGIQYANKPSTAAEREHKKAQKELVKSIASKWQIDELYKDFLMDNGYNLTKNFFEYAAEFMERKAPISEADLLGMLHNKLAFKKFMRITEKNNAFYYTSNNAQLNLIKIEFGTSASIGKE